MGSSRKVSQWTRATIWDPHTVDLLFVLAQPPADQLHAAERVLAEEVQQVRQLRRQQAAGAGAAADGQEGWGSRLEGAAAAAAAVESDENVRGLAEGDDDGVDIVMVPGLVSRYGGFPASPAVGSARTITCRNVCRTPNLVASPASAKPASVWGLRPRLT